MTQQLMKIALSLVLPVNLDTFLISDLELLKLSPENVLQLITATRVLLRKSSMDVLNAILDSLGNQMPMVILTTLNVFRFP